MDPTVAFEYDGEKNIVFTEDSGDIQTREEVDAFFDQYESYLNQLAKKVYVVANIDNLMVRSVIADYYGAQAQKRAVQHILGFARWGTNTSARLTVRTSSANANIPARIFDTREEAVEEIEELKAAGG